MPTQFSRLCGKHAFILLPSGLGFYLSVRPALEFFLLSSNYLPSFALHAFTRSFCLFTPVCASSCWKRVGLCRGKQKKKKKRNKISVHEFRFSNILLGQSRLNSLARDEKIGSVFVRLLKSCCFLSRLLEFQTSVFNTFARGSGTCITVRFPLLIPTMGSLCIVDHCLLVFLFLCWCTTLSNPRPHTLLIEEQGSE